MTRAVLLDLDGTLSDSRPGIADCFRYTVGQLGHDPAAAGDLTWAVGPPNHVSMRRLLALYGDDRVDQAVDIYRAHYSSVAIYDCSVYPGVVGMLDALHDAGLAMCVATSKRQDFAERVIDYLGLRGYIRTVYGALPDGGLDNKQDLLAHILEAERFIPAETVMVGDRLHDMFAARHNAIRSIGALFLLCHKIIRCARRWQQGQRGRVRAMARAIATRTEVIELAICRSGRIGRSAGSVTVGKARLFDEHGVALS